MPGRLPGVFPLEQAQASGIPGASGWRGFARKPWLFLRKSAIGSRWFRGAGIRHLSGDCVLPGPGDPQVIKGGPGFPICCPKPGKTGCPQQEGGWVSAVPGSSQPRGGLESGVGGRRCRCVRPTGRLLACFAVGGRRISCFAPRGCVCSPLGPRVSGGPSSSEPCGGAVALKREPLPRPSELAEVGAG